MEHSFEEVAQAALSLPEPQRSQLVERLNESLSDSVADAAVMDSWIKLARTRLEDVRSGTVETVDGPTGLKTLREKVRG